MLDGTGKQLLDLLKRLDSEDVTYDQLVDDAREAVDIAQSALDELLSLEGLCDATTLKTPSGRKRRKDRNQPRKRKSEPNGAEEPAIPETPEA